MQHKLFRFYNSCVCRFSEAYEQTCDIKLAPYDSRESYILRLDIYIYKADQNCNNMSSFLS